MKSNKYIQISYIFGQDTQVGALRNYYIFKHLGKAFTKNILFSSNKTEVKEGESTYIAPMDYTLFIPSRNRRITQNKNTIIANITARLKNSFPFFILLNLGGPIYIIKCYRKIKKRYSSNEDIVLYSSYDPMADHLIAYLLKRINSKIFWIADFRDLPVDPIKKNSLWPGLDKWFIKQLLGKADLVTTVSNGLAEHFLKLTNNVLVIPNAIDECLINKEDFTKGEIFRIGYTGSVHRELQAIDPLLLACRSLRAQTNIELELHYAGPQSDYWKFKIDEYNLDGIFFDHGMVTRKIAMEIQRSNHVNVIFSWNFPGSGGNLTMKLYEYLAARRKIMVIMNGSRDPEFEKILEETRSGIQFLREDIEPMTKYLEKLINNHASFKSLNTNTNLSLFTWEVSVNTLTQYLEKLNS